MPARRLRLLGRQRLPAARPQRRRGRRRRRRHRQAVAADEDVDGNIVGGDKFVFESCARAWQGAIHLEDALVDRWICHGRGCAVVTLTSQRT